MKHDNREKISIKPVLDVHTLDRLKRSVNEVFVDEKVVKYALNLVCATRNHDGVALGVSPRGSVLFIRAAKAYALTEGRNYVTPADLQKLVSPCLAHRIQLKQSFTKKDSQMDAILKQIIERVPVPIERK